MKYCLKLTNQSRHKYHALQHISGAKTKTKIPKSESHSKFSRFQQPNMSRIPPNGPRTLATRTDGLFRKANTLYHLLHPKVAVLILPNSGRPQAYVSHGAADWPALHELVSSLGFAPQDLRTPDDIDTVSQRFGRATSFSSDTTSMGSVASGDESARVMEMLAPLAEETEGIVSLSAAVSNHNTAPPSFNVADPEMQSMWSMPNTPEPSATNAEHRAPEARMSPAGLTCRRERKAKCSRDDPLNAGIRKSKSSSSPGNKRPKIMTRSQDKHRRSR